LLAFIIVCAAVLLLRIRRPDAPRPFRCPAVYLLAPLGIFINLLMMMFLPLDTWIRLFGWLAVGLVIYLGYSYRHTTLGHELVARLSGQGIAVAAADYYRSSIYRQRLQFGLMLCSILCCLSLLWTAIACILYLLGPARLADAFPVFDPSTTVAVSIGLSTFMIFMALVNIMEWRKLRASTAN